MRKQALLSGLYLYEFIDVLASTGDASGDEQGRCCHCRTLGVPCARRSCLRRLAPTECSPWRKETQSPQTSASHRLRLSHSRLALDHSAFIRPRQSAIRRIIRRYSRKSGAILARNRGKPQLSQHAIASLLSCPEAMVTLPEDRLRFWYGQTPTSAPPQPRCGCLFATVLPFFAPIPPSDATIQNNLRSAPMSESSRLPPRPDATLRIVPS